MLSIAHGPTGALITTKLPLYLAIPLTLAAHYLEDFIPHWDVGQGMTKKTKSKKSAFWQELLFDFPGSIILTYLIFQINKPFDIKIWLGWFLALLPDFLEFPYTFLGWKFFPIKQLAKFHSSVHFSTHKKLIGLLPQIAVIVIIFALSR